LLEIVDRARPQPIPREQCCGRARMSHGAAPHAHPLDRPDEAVRIGELPRDAPRPDDDEMLRVLAGEPARGIRRGPRRAARRDLFAVEQRERGAIPGIEQRIHRADRALPASRIAGEYRHELDADPPGSAPGGHQQQRSRGLAGHFDRMVGTQRRRDLVVKHRVERSKHSRPRQACANRGGIEVLHRLRRVEER
jgi:hypothetical protein